MQNMLENLIQIYGIQDESKFKEYLNKAVITATTGKRPTKDKTLVIVGGQPGAGKSRLIGPSNAELENNAVIVDFDELRAMHPSYGDVSRNYPEITYKILQKDTDTLKVMLQNYLIEHDYNVIYEGALRNVKGFLELGQAFKNGGYNVNMNVMAVPKLESYGSTLVRYAYNLLTDRIPRWVEKSAHDDAYDAMLKTIQAFKENGIVDNINVYMRSIDVPKKIYSTGKGQFRDAISAILYGRETDRRKAVENYPEKYNFVKQVFEQKQPELLDRLAGWQELYNKEIKYLESLSNMQEK